MMPVTSRFRDKGMLLEAEVLEELANGQELPKKVLEMVAKDTAALEKLREERAEPRTYTSIDPVRGLCSIREYLDESNEI